MRELGFQEQQQRRSWRRAGSRRGVNAGDTSPDSVIFTLESNLSLFSSASASVDRCSFASDAHDHDSLASEISLHLSGHGDFAPSESWSGADPDPDLSKQQHADGSADVVQKKKLRETLFSGKGEKTKECQDRRSRCEALFKKPDRRRPASLDLNANAIGNVVSPRLGLGAMKKSSVASRRSGSGVATTGTGTFPSPGTPNYRQGGVAMQKGWCSERVPLHSSGTRKQICNGGAGVLPFNNGRTLPSKWEDAERWILSPVSGDGGTGRSSLPQPQRRPKSKSGPLGPPGLAYYSLFSPAVPFLEGGNFMAASPFSAAVNVSADGLRNGSRSNGGGVLPTRTDPCMARSVSVHGCSQMQDQSSFPAQEEKFDGFKDAATNVSRAVSSRDMATQMSPEGSSCSSPNMRPFSASTPPALPITELQSVSFSKMDIRDVQVDERVTVTRWSKKHKALFSGRGSESVDSWKKKETTTQPSSWDISERAKTVTEAKREEAKITAWENLQKAKAEAAIRKLEMKLEKKRASSMDKIMNKLRLSQKKAQEMRSSVLANQVHEVARTSHKIISFRRTRQMSSLSGCFTCHAF